MLELIKRNYWQPEIEEYIKKYVQRYTKCQQNKVQHIKKARKLHPLEIPDKPQQEISINIIGPLLRSNDKDMIVVIVDQFSKIIRLKAIDITVSLEEIARIYQDKIQKLYRVLQKILSNRGPQFASKFMKDLIEVLVMKRTLSTVY